MFKNELNVHSVFLLFSFQLIWSNIIELFGSDRNLNFIYNLNNRYNLEGSSLNIECTHGLILIFNFLVVGGWGARAQISSVSNWQWRGIYTVLYYMLETRSPTIHNYWECKGLMYSGLHKESVSDGDHRLWCSKPANLLGSLWKCLQHSRRTVA